MAKNTFRVPFGKKLVVEYLYGSTVAQIGPEELPEIEQALRELIRLDGVSKYLAPASNLIKSMLFTRFGKGVRYIHYKSAKGKDWQVAIYLRYRIEPEKALERLIEQGRPDIAAECITTGTAGRVVYPATLENRNEVMEMMTETTESKGGVIEHYSYAQLEVLCREKLLISRCRKEHISLTGTRVPYMTFVVKEEKKPSPPAKP